MTDFPEAVSNAIAAVMADIPKLARDETNKHANYQFASFDAFLDAVRPLCAKQLLVVEQDEVACDIVQTTDKYGKAADWLRVKYAFTLAVGGSKRGPIMRSIMVRADMGSQAFGAAQSYAMKQFMRSLFQISTGDGDDADNHEQSSIASAPVKAAFPVGPCKNKTALDTAITAFCTHIAALTNDADLEAYVSEQTPVLAQYRAVYGRDSEHVAAIHTQLANARERVKARAGTPHDAEPVPVEAQHVWPETVQQLVAQIGNRDTAAALSKWVELPATKAIMATLEPVELAYVRGAYRDRVAGCNAMAELSA